MTKLDFKILLVWFALLGTLLCMVSCGGSQPPVDRSSTIIKDSTVTEITYHKRDTTITIPGDTLKVKVPFYELTPEPKTFTSGTQKANVSLSADDVLTVDCITEEVNRLFELIDTVKSTLNTVQTTTTETIIVPERYVPWYVKILAWIGGIVLVIIAATILTKFIKP